MALTATQTKVLETLHVDTANQNEERVLAYLQQFIGSMKQGMIQRVFMFHHRKLSVLVQKCQSYF